MKTYSSMHGLGFGRPGPSRGVSIEEQIAWDRAVQDFRDAKISRDLEKAAAAAMALSEGTKRPVRGSVDTKRLAHAAAELETTGKASPVQVKIAVFNGGYGRDWEPESTGLTYRTSPLPTWRK